MSEHPHYRRRDGVLTGIILALCLGLTDVSIAIVTRHPALGSLGALIPPAGAVAVVVFLVWIAGWFGVLAPLGRLLGVNRMAMGVTVGFFVGTFFVLADLNAYSPFPRNPYKLGLILLIATLIAGGARFAVAAISHNGALAARYRSAVVALPMILALTTLFQWIHHYRVGSFTSANALGLGVAWIATVFVVAAAAYVFGHTRFVRIKLAAMLVALALGPVTVLLSPRSSSPAGVGTFGGGINHVILIIVDTLRADRLTCYDPGGPGTPNIDGLAEEAVVFRSPISPAPWTLPAVASIMTGLPVPAHGAVAEDSRLPDELTMLAERMRSAGYRTDALGRNPILATPRNLDQGFGAFRFFPRRAADGSVGTRLLRRLRPERYRSDATTSDLTDLAVDYVHENSADDFFFYLHYEDPHGPYEPPPAFRPEGKTPERIGYRFARNKQIRAGTLVPTAEERDWIMALYDGEVRYVDQQIGRLFDAMKEAGMYDDALIVLTSDHGEEFFEHGNVAHGHTLYNELLHVPLIVKLPKAGGAKGSFEGFVSVQRIAPTILDLCGIPYDAEEFLGTSLSEFWAGEGALANDSPYSTGVLYYGERESVVFDGLKYIRSVDDSRHELFDLEKDPGEQTSLGSSRPTDVLRARRFLDGARKAAEGMREMYDLPGQESIELDEETIKRLKALGYM